MHHTFSARRLAAPLAAAAFLAAAPAARAAGTVPAPSPSPSASPLTEIGRVVTPDRQSERTSASTRTVFVITKADIINNGYTSVADALARVPGVEVQRYGAAGSQANVFIRGASTQQTLVLVDGVPAYGAQIGGVDLGPFSTTGVERIEVVEGGGSTLYGNAAVGGVINIITGANHGGSNLSAYSGSFGDRAINLEAGPLSFERRVAANGYTYIDPANGSTQTRTNDDFSLWNARLADGKQIGSVRVDGSLAINDSQLGVPGPLGYLSTTSRQDTLNETADALVTHVGAQSRASIDLSASLQALNFYSAANDPNGCACGNDYNTESRLQLSLRDVVNAGNQNLVYGADLAHGVGRIDAGNGANTTLGFAETAIYAQDTVEFARVRLYGGVRAEQDGGIGGSIDPSLGATFVLFPTVRLKANYADAFRVPTLVDLAYPGFSNPDLVPERAHVTDVTVVNSRAWGDLSLGWFNTAATDLISVNPDFNYAAPPSAQNLPIVNIQQASIAGVTLIASTNPVNGISARAGITDLYRALGFLPTETRLPDRAVFNVTLGLQYSGAPRAALASAGIGTRSLGARGAGADPYTVVDAFARFRIAREALLTLRTFNLGNARYFDVPGYPSPGRSFAFELSTR